MKRAALSSAGLSPSLLVHPSGSTDGVNIQVSYHVWTSDVLTHLQSDQIGLLKADAAVDQQERPHEAEDKKKKKTTL